MIGNGLCMIAIGKLEKGEKRAGRRTKNCSNCRQQSALIIITKEQRNIKKAKRVRLLALILPRTKDTFGSILNMILPLILTKERTRRENYYSNCSHRAIIIL